MAPIRRKRPRDTNRPKLLVDDIVEVRSVEEGFQGSWHTATVIACENLIRRVQYHHLLCDDGSDHLVECVNVSLILDGVFLPNEAPSNYRGLIRPLPPPIDLAKWGLHYGLCVDVFHQDAWWEGVIFDHEDGSKERKIFFPDMGDELNAQLEILRITQDWDEGNEYWKPRGKWLFLELIEGLEQEWPLLVSVKQVWYEIQIKDGFEILKEWTTSARDSWRGLLLNIIMDNLKLTCKEFFHKLNSSMDLVQENQLLPELSDSKLDAVLNSEAYLGNSLPVGPSKSTSQLDGEHPTDINNTRVRPVVDEITGDCLESVREDDRRDMNPMTSSIMPSREEAPRVRPLTLLILPSNSDEISMINSSKNSEEFSGISSKKPIGNIISLKRTPIRHNWLPAHHGEAEFCPDAVTEYAKVGSRNLALNVKKHLLYMGWKIEFMIDIGKGDRAMTRLRYISPAGKAYQSLLQVCRDLTGFVSALITQNDLVQLSSPTSESWFPAHHGEAEFCPDAVTEYAKVGSRNLALNVKKHLLYMGWKIEFMIDIGKGDRAMTRLRYISPAGKAYQSLLQVCRDLTGFVSALITQNDLVQLSSPTSESWFPAHHGEAEFCPDAVTEYAKVGSRNLTLNVKKHLLYMGWRIEFMIDIGKGDRAMTRLRYISPAGKAYQSLLQVCRDLTGFVSALITQNDLVQLSSPTSEQQKVCEAPERSYHSDLVVIKPDMPSPSDLVDVKPEYCPRSVVDYYMLGLHDVNAYRGSSKCSKKQEMKTKAKQHLSSIGWSFHYFREGHRQLRYRSPCGRSYYSLRSACKLCIDEGGLCNSNAYTFGQTQKNNVSNEANGHIAIKKLPSELRTNKRAREVMVPSSSHHTPRTVLSWLIDNNVVLPRAKVYYRSRKDCHVMAEGRITRDGIKCNCCQIVFTLSNFEAHAGSTNHRPSANIFLEDGRSLMECQLQLKHNNNASSVRKNPHEMKGVQHYNMNDYICSVCQYGGELVLCDQCPSSFHISCLGLKDVPDGDWFCPSCCCGICGQSSFDKDTGKFTDNSVLNCDQCERKYHVGCLRKKGLVKLDRYPKVNWFCSDRCEQIFLGLRRLLGKPIPAGVDNLTWTLMKYMKIEGCDSDASDIEVSMENYSKLSVALGVMHECFEPVKEPHTRRDLVEDVIFSMCSKLNRLNFRGFYTMVLEKNDELISVATVRVYGEKVAEIPLVGTRLQYRRLGMCRILMNELEKNLKELGVERLVLPAIPSVLNTWTTSFGFSMMTEPEKLNFLDYTFLNFQGTIMCQKLLKEIPSTELILSKGIEEKLHHDINGANSGDLDGNSAVSEVFQADQIEESGIVDQGLVDVAGGNGIDRENNNDKGNEAAPLVNQPPHDEHMHCQSEINLDFSVEAAHHQKEVENIGNGHFKCYKRRKISP